MSKNEIINEAWERLPEESSKAYNAFETYLKMGYKRSLNKLCMVLGIKYPTHLLEWKKKFKWDDRILAYENEQSKHKLLADIELYKSITEKQLSMAANLKQLIGIPLIIITERLKSVSNEKSKAIQDFDKLSTVDLYKLIIDSTKFIDVIVKIERLALGKPPEMKSEDINPEMFGNLIAGDENATKLLSELINSIDENGKSIDNGFLAHSG